MSNKKLTKKRLLGLFSEKYKGNSVCESCGEEFVCGATIKGCWCMKINLTADVGKELKSKFDGCLCKGCLEKFGNRQVS